MFHPLFANTYLDLRIEHEAIVPDTYSTFGDHGFILSFTRRCKEQYKREYGKISSSNIPYLNKDTNVWEKTTIDHIKHNMTQYMNASCHVEQNCI